MRGSQFKIGFVAAVVGCGLFAFLALLSGPGFYSRWHSLKDGMTQAEVRQLLGTPTWTGNGQCIGAGGRPVTRWEYRINVPGRVVHYCVDFDYIGPSGAPAVFRTERFFTEGNWPWWCPWAAKSRA